MSFVRFSKLVVVGAAVAVGLFLSIASHAFGWSTGSTFAVACALIGVLSLTGPALILLGESLSGQNGRMEQDQPRLARLQIEKGMYESESTPQSSHGAQILSRLPLGGGEVENRLWLPRSSAQNYGLGEVGYFGELSRGKQRDLNAPEGYWNLAPKTRGRVAEERRSKPSAADLAVFGNLAGRQRSTSGEGAVSFDGPESAVLAQ